MPGPFFALYLPLSVSQAQAVNRPFAPIPICTKCGERCQNGPPKDFISNTDPALAVPGKSAQVVPAAQQIEMHVTS